MKNCGGLNQIVIDFIGDFAMMSASELLIQSEPFLWSHFEVLTSLFKREPVPELPTTICPAIFSSGTPKSQA